MKNTLTSFIILISSTMSTYSSEISEQINEVTKNKTIIGWEQFHADTRYLANIIKDKGPFEGIVGISRGGFGAALIMAHELGIKKMESFGVRSYGDEKKQGEFDVYSPFASQDPWLVVDELTDSGKTVKLIKEKYLPNSVFVAVYAKPNGISAIDYYAKQTEQNVWLEFIWEITTTK